MMKNRLLQGALLFLITIFLLGCNVDASEGIFTQISKSEPVEEVGTVTLIVKDGNDYYALTSHKGLQKYDATEKEWSSIGGNLVRHVSTNTDDSDNIYIYYAQQALADENNELYKYVIATGDTSAHLPGGYPVIAMSPPFDLMLVRDGETSYAVRNVSSGPAIIEDLSFSAPPQLIVQDATHFIVSGEINENTYKHIFYNGTEGIELDSDNPLFEKQPIVAFHFNNPAELVAVSSDGTVWEGGPTALSTEGSVSLPSRNPDSLPYPVVHHNNKLYLQDANKKFVTISTASGENLGQIAEATEDFAGQLTTIKIFSYLVDVEDPNIVYAGTTENGIYQIDFTDGTATRL